MALSNPVTLTIIAATVISSLAAFNNYNLFNRWKFNAYAVKHERQLWRFLTYGFIHADYPHLFINMIVLWSFGDFVEQAYRVLFPGNWLVLFLILYFVGMIISTLFSFIRHRDNPAYNAVGASGAVSAITFASILMDPTGGVYLFFIPIPIPAVVFGLLYLVYSYVMARKAKDNIGHDAHFWGAIFGVVFTLACEPSLAINFWRQILLYLGM